MLYRKPIDSATILWKLVLGTELVSPLEDVKQHTHIEKKNEEEEHVLQDCQEVLDMHSRSAVMQPRFPAISAQ